MPVAVNDTTDTFDEEPVPGPSDSPQPPKVVRALSPAQERKLVDYLEDRFLDVTRNYKKRFVLPLTPYHPSGSSG